MTERLRILRHTWYLQIFPNLRNFGKKRSPIRMSLVLKDHSQRTIPMFQAEALIKAAKFSAKRAGDMHSPYSVGANDARTLFKTAHERHHRERSNKRSQSYGLHRPSAQVESVVWMVPDFDFTLHHANTSKPCLVPNRHHDIGSGVATSVERSRLQIYRGLNG